MSLSKEDAIEKARTDLAQRLGIATSEIKELSVEDAEFPDMALGAAMKGEMDGAFVCRLTTRLSNIERIGTRFDFTTIRARIIASEKRS